MTPIETLIREHEAVRQTLRILEKITETIETTGEIPDREKRIGPGRHEAFHEMLYELDRKYLGG